MKKRVLLISYYFAPQNTIGAIRPTKMAKYLERLGYEVTVICGGGLDGKVDPTLQRDLAQMKDVRLIQEWNPLRERALKKAQAKQIESAQNQTTQEKSTKQPSPSLLSRMKRVFGKTIDNIYIYLMWLSDRDFGRKAKKEVRKLEKTYDCVLSSYASYSVHELACYAKRTGKAKKWIADFRDEVNMSFWWQEGKRKRYLKMVQQNADIISAVSFGFLEMMGLEKVGRVLSNGFDREDLAARPADASVTSDKLRVVYCGFISEGRKHVANRDISPMMRTLRALIDEGLLRLEDLQLVYAGEESHLFRAVAAESGLEGCVEDHGLVTRDESIQLQLGADILLMASWHMASQRGILTGKLFEYMMMNKPVVCCMAGDLTGSDVKGVLETTGIGFCCEQAAGQADRDALKAYVREVVVRKQSHQPLMDSSHIEAINAYSYPGLAARMGSWIDE